MEPHITPGGHLFLKIKYCCQISGSENGIAGFFTEVIDFLSTYLILVGASFRHTNTYLIDELRSLRRSVNEV